MRSRQSTIEESTNEGTIIKRRETNISLLQPNKNNKRTNKIWREQWTGEGICEWKE